MYFTFQGHLHREVGWLIFNMANYSSAFWYFIQYELLRGVSPITAWCSFRLCEFLALIRVFPRCMQRFLLVCSDPKFQRS